MHTVQVLNHLVANHQVLAYLIIFVGLIFEGEIVVITAGVLSYLGVLSFWLSLAFILAGGMAKTFGVYYLGEFVYEKYNHLSFLKFIEKRVLYFIPRFKQKPFWSIFVSKFIMSVNFWVIVFCGYNKINYKTFVKAELLSTIIWAPLLLSLGYFFSQTALSYSKEINKFSLAIFFLLVIFLLFDKLVATLYRIFEYFKNNITDNNNGNK
jgi:membrane protein DedA with SNARE-associated domain